MCDYTNSKIIFNFTSFKRKLLVYLQENDMTFFKVLNILFYSLSPMYFIHLFLFYTVAGGR